MPSDESDKVACRNCYYDLKKGIRRCPYCGILNPTLTLKNVFVMIFIITFIMSIYTYFQ